MGRETRTTHEIMRAMPTINLGFRYSPNKKKDITEVNTQYMENNEVITPWFMPARVANLNPRIMLA